MNSLLPLGCISADSHIVEAHNTYRGFIDSKYRADAPHIERDAKGNDVYVIPGMTDIIPLGLVAGAGVPSKDLASRHEGSKFEDLHRSGWDPTYRIEDQDRDG